MLFNRRKKDTTKDLYPTLNLRLFASLIDIGIAAIILIPLSNIVLYSFNDDILYSKQLISLSINESIKITKDFRGFFIALSDHKSFKDFIDSRGYLLLLLEQGLQFILLLFIILMSWIKFQSTPGKMLSSLKIVDANTLAKPTPVQFFIRFLSYIFSILPLGFGLLYIALNKKRRALHDLISDTIVVSEKELKRHYANRR